jgi:hypothetical protein
MIIGVPETDQAEQSPITNYGAQRTVIEKLTIRGSAEPPSSSGIAVAGAANVKVRHCVVENNHWSGIYAGPGSWVRIDDCIIQNNGGDGVRIAQTGFAEVTNSTIQDNGRAGIGIHQQGAAFIGVTIIGDSGPNTIESNSDGIVVNGPGRADIRNNTIEDNSHSGVFADLGGSVVLTNNTISGSGEHGLLLNEGSNGRLEAGNTIVSAAANIGVAAAVAVSRNSSLHIRGGGNVLENTASRSITNEFWAAGGFALNVETVSSVLVDSGHTTIIGNVKSFNQTTVDLRNVDITGSVYADGLDGNMHFTDQTQPSGNVTITDGNVYTFGGSVSIWGGAQLPTFDADIDCNGSSVFINSPIFINGHGFVNCPGIP